MWLLHFVSLAFDCAPWIFYFKTAKSNSLFTFASDIFKVLEMCVFFVVVVVFFLITCLNVYLLSLLWIQSVTVNRGTVVLLLLLLKCDQIIECVCVRAIHLFGISFFHRKPILWLRINLWMCVWLIIYFVCVCFFHLQYFRAFVMRTIKRIIPFFFDMWSYIFDSCACH